MTEQEIYEKFIAWMNSPLMEWAESEVMMPMITSFITPEEAEFLTGFPWSSKSLEEIAQLKNVHPAEVAPKLKDFCDKGLIYESIRGDSRRYRLLDAFQVFLRMPFWAGKDHETLKTMAHYANRYYMDGWMDQDNAVRYKPLRSLPINKTLENKKQILPFEDVLQVIDNHEYYVVSHCPCRERHRLDPDYQDSSYPSEVCLHFDELGRYCVEHGMGREITKEETLEILKKAADAGLVHGVSNWEKNPDTICNCDPTYCTVFRSYHHLGHDKAMDPSNYRVKVASPETCKACGLCVKRCPMDAIQLHVSAKATNKFCKVVKVNTELCIGCGVCVHKCPTQSIVLERRDEITRPPKDIREYAELLISDKQAAKQKQA
jgi:formate hydrogenlyase subunit 6/NADH:ubiquinone oxidoreductase subunit I